MVRRIALSLSAAVALLCALGSPAAGAPPPDATAMHRVEPGRSGFLGGGTLARPPLKVRWRVPLGVGWSAPLVVDGRVFTSSAARGSLGSSTVVALDPATGALIWERVVPSASKLAYEDGRLVVLNRSGLVQALDAADGRTLWSTTVPEPYSFVTEPVVHDGLVYIGVSWSGGAMHALRLSDGSTAHSTSVYYASTPAVAGGLAFQTDGCQTVAVDARSGAPGWRTDTGCDGWDGEVVSVGGHVVADGGSVDAGVLDGASGAVLDGFATNRSPAIAGDTLVHRDDELLRARSLSTGLPIWSSRAALREASPPLVVDHVVYVGTGDGRLLAMALGTGEVLWSDTPAPGGGDVGASGLGVGGGILVVPVDEELVAYEAALPAAAPGAGLRVTSGPEGPTRETTARFTFTTPPAAARTECRLDAAPWLPCVEEAEYVATEGSHTFSVRAVDAAGTPQALAHRGFSVDTTAPTTTITDAPRPQTNTRYATFAFSAPRSSHSECRLDGAEWWPCSQRLELQNLADGPHVFEVRSHDVAGNIESPPAEHRWLVDRSPPRITIEQRPPAASRERNATVRWTTSEEATSVCRFNFGEETSCESPFVRANLPDGTYSVRIRVWDAAGNGSEEQVVWTVDNVAPDSRFTSNPPATTGPDPSFSFVANEFSVRFECRIDDAEWRACVSPWRPGPLEEGQHVVAVRATDQADNVEPVPAEHAFRSVGPPPEVELDERPPARTTATVARVTFRSTHPETDCSWDGGAWEDCASPAERSGFAEGRHTVSVRATDEIGRTAVATAEWTVDRTPPQTHREGGPGDGAATSGTSATFDFSSGDAFGFSCRLDGGGWFDCAAPYTVRGLSNGAHTFEVAAYDDLGTTDPTPATWSWTVVPGPEPGRESTSSSSAGAGPPVGATPQHSPALHDTVTMTPSAPEETGLAIGRRGPRAPSTPGAVARAVVGLLSGITPGELLTAGAARLNLEAPRAGTYVVELRARDGRRAVLASGRAKARRAGSVTGLLKPTAAGRRRLGRTRRVTVRVTFGARGRKTLAATRTATIGGGG